MGSYGRIEYKAGDDLGNGMTILDPTRIKIPGTDGKQAGLMVECWCGVAFLSPIPRLLARRGHDRSCAKMNPHPQSQDRVRVNEEHAAWVRGKDPEKAQVLELKLAVKAARARKALLKERVAETTRLYRLQVEEQQRDPEFVRKQAEEAAQAALKARAAKAESKRDLEGEKAQERRLDSFAPLVAEAVEAFRRDWGYSEELARAAFKLRGKDPLSNEQVTVTA